MGWEVETIKNSAISAKKRDTTKGTTFQFFFPFGDILNVGVERAADLVLVRKAVRMLQFTVHIQHDPAK